MGRTAHDTFATTNDGLRLHLIRYEGSEPPSVLFVHGAFGHAHAWDFVVEALPDAMPVQALDLPGHGDSEWSAEPDRYEFSRLIDDVGAAVEAVGPPVVLAGHSIGSALTMHYAASRPETLAGVVLMDIDPLSPQEHADHLNNAGAKPAKRFATLAEVRKREARVAPQASALVHARLAEHGYRETSEGYVQRFDQAFLRAVTRWDARPLLSQVTAPALVMRGGDSTVMTVRGYQQLLEGLPDVRGRVIEGATHQLHLDRPAEVAAEIARFVESRCRGR